MIIYKNITHYVRTISGVNEDLVVGVSFSLDLLGAVGYRGLRFAKGGENRFISKSQQKTAQL